MVSKSSDTEAWVNVEAPVTASAPARFSPPPAVKSVPALPILRIRPVLFKSMFEDTDTMLSKSVCPPKITEVEEVVPSLALKIFQSVPLRYPSAEADA